MHTQVERRLGDIVEHYRLLSVLGTGGTSTVYLGQREDDPRVLVAVKVLMDHANAEHADQTSFRLRFLREARAASKLHHDHILPVLSYGEAHGLTYMVLPAVAGTLADRLAGRTAPLPLPTIADYLAQVASALDYAHERGIVHRDIKPSNILLDARDWVYLADFGIARLFGGGTNALTRDGSATLTSTGQVLGTPNYMAPEQIRGEPIGPATDVYALGVVAYQLVTGQMPFQGDTPLSVVVQHMLEAPKLPRLLRAELPTRAQMAVLRALAKLPDDRFASAGAFADAFAAGLADAPPSEAQADSDETHPTSAATTPVGFALPAATPRPPLAHAARELPGVGAWEGAEGDGRAGPDGHHASTSSAGTVARQRPGAQTPRVLAAPVVDLPPRRARATNIRRRGVLAGVGALALLGVLLALLHPLPVLPWFAGTSAPREVFRHAGVIPARSPDVSSAIATPTDTPEPTPTAVPVRLTAVAVTPARARLVKGKTQQFKALGSYSDGGQQDTSSAVSWVSSDDTVVTITKHGLATGVGAGTATIMASEVGVVSNLVTVTVLPVAVLASIAVTPMTIVGGQSASGTVTLSDPAPDTGAVVTLTSANSDPSIKTALAQVPSSVTVPAGQLASAPFQIATVATTTDAKVSISAVYGGVSKQVSLTVTAPPPPCSVPINDGNPHPYITSVMFGPAGSAPTALPSQTKEGTSDGQAGSVTHYFCSAGTAATIATFMTGAFQTAGWTAGSGSYPGGGCDWSLKSGSYTWCLKVSIADPADWTITERPPM